MKLLHLSDLHLGKNSMNFLFMRIKNIFYNGLYR